MKMLIVLVVLMGSRGQSFVSGLTCYQCQSDSLTSPCVSGKDLDVTNCNGKFCTIFRQELLDPSGKLTSFSRACEKNPKYLNAIIESGDLRTYYRACDRNICNKGNGIKEILQDAIIDSSENAIVVPGIGSSASRSVTTSLSFSLLLTLIQFH